MSIVNRLILATPATVRAYHEAENSPHYDFGDITDLDISTLLAIAATETFDFDAHELLPLDDTDDDNADIYPIPERYTRIFARLNAADIARCSAAWAASEELDCDAADLLPIIENLCALARRIENGQQLYFITA